MCKYKSYVMWNNVHKLGTTPAFRRKLFYLAALLGSARSMAREPALDLGFVQISLLCTSLNSHCSSCTLSFLPSYSF